ncbi:PDR/VanB family oxidoreductase [Mycobacteroides chelonae]|uniref:PDR/VanB family oxidoreductase n=1 Tax=Mycobacteroides chelonae TaxID=1774 RepID=UPI0004AB14F7|nr:PDR/VanB family oxidoreductase [Mycobacteroides chelonae]MBF9318858.1 oxidoreductase [Mycobacteroides chelonae]OHT70857.1 oxidoreductase [Mycobacteroides chelonae]OHT71782.1 oxidoreductase [Mycobacteroides chelonae]OHT85658.1 oxidoreductase [Mycobacteroides chelonae]
MKVLDVVGPTAVAAFGKTLPAVLRLSPLLGPVRQPTWVDRSLNLVVRERSVVAADQDVVAFTLSAVGGGELPRWRPGAHLDVTLPSGAVRQYSLCGDPRDRYRYRIAVRRIPEGKGGSIELHDAVRVGDVLGVKGPRNAFPLATTGHLNAGVRQFHFVAGGIGITPILPMLAVATERGLPWTMTYAGRSKESIPFRDELARYGERITVRTDDEDGMPTAADLLPPLHPDLAVYCCGPGPMLKVIRDAVAEYPGAELHFERFSAPPIENGVPFQVQLGGGGPVLDVGPQNSALDAVLAARPGTPYSCRQGFCGTCKVKVLAGNPDHRDTLLTETQRAEGQMLLCVSRADGGRLVLDI